MWQWVGCVRCFVFVCLCCFTAKVHSIASGVWTDLPTHCICAQGVSTSFWTHPSDHIVGKFQTTVRDLPGTQFRNQQNKCSVNVWVCCAATTHNQIMIRTGSTPHSFITPYYYHHMPMSYTAVEIQIVHGCAHWCRSSSGTHRPYDQTPGNPHTSQMYSGPVPWPTHQTHSTETQRHCARTKSDPRPHPHTHTHIRPTKQWCS